MIFSKKTNRKFNFIDTSFYDGFFDFFKKKTPKSDSYPYDVYHPYDVLGEKSGYEGFYLVGENWIDFPEKPIALCWGFNDWKLGFVAAYLSEYRVAFASRKIKDFIAFRKLFSIKVKPACFIVWGYNESFLIRSYSKFEGIPLYRMEDGFVRSASIGASHSVPYSLVIDKSGALYYDGSKISDIENLLNNYDYEADPTLLNKSRQSLALLQELRISKYNQSDELLTPPVRNIKTKTVVAVLGQVDSDASIRLGNPDNWSSEELVRLAAYENPESEILYRPHPEIYKGYQKSRFKKKKIENFAAISSPDLSMSEFLDGVDHVYTITSLTGLEALIRGIKVTVVGVPFYAGWGLTDDRITIKRRQRALTIDELFAGSYLLYPQYLANLNDSYIGFTSACYRINADRFIGVNDIFSGERKDFSNVINTAFWPKAFFDTKFSKDPEDLTMYISALDFSKVFPVGCGKIYQSSVMYAILGVLKSTKQKDAFIRKARAFINYEVLNDVLIYMDVLFPGSYVFEHISWLLSENGEAGLSNKILSKAVPHELNEIRDSIIDEGGVIDEGCIVNLNSNNLKLMLHLFQQTISAKDFDTSLSVSKLLLISNYSIYDVLKGVLAVSELKFDFESSLNISSFMQGIDILRNNRDSVVAEVKSVKYIPPITSIEYHQLLVKMLVLKPEQVAFALFIIENNPDFFNENFSKLIIKGILNLDNDISRRKAQCYLALENPLKAKRTLERLIINSDNSDMTRVIYSQALSFNGEVGKAMKVMDAARLKNPTSAILRESMRLCVLESNYAMSLELLNSAESLRINLGDMHKRKAYFGNRMIFEAFDTFRDIQLVKTVSKYYPEKYYSFKEKLLGEELITLIAIFGPGDEIRFASIYNIVMDVLGIDKLSITCSPRLYELFSRSFPRIKFVPVHRPRNFEKINLEEYSHVPGSDIISVINNAAVNCIEESDYFLFVTDMLHACLPSYEAFSGEKYLTADIERCNEFKEALPEGEFIIGISWRSSLTTHSRNEHYLSIEEISPLFRVPGIKFVNLQYDECDEELEWVEKQYPGKLINFSDLDQYNDFEGVAALMSCLDLIISPATTVVELAGALGIPTWLFSNSSEIDWRKKDSEGSDVWHSSVEVVDCESVGNKPELVNCLKRKLENIKFTRY
ncbi:capsular polysaccharide export protein, LipB/KpsS family [Aliamphritea ceti]|uniref:capsular polysaccharide export protein, LipB/KpsS family n=1 Tax=Aliamphritea ceti TaxID=1524258 RepID=UPI0021C3F18E|nr:hypothetical protein [Aliamphritea ceti]